MFKFVPLKEDADVSELFPARNGAAVPEVCGCKAPGQRMRERSGVPAPIRASKATRQPGTEGDTGRTLFVFRKLFK